MKDRAHEKQTPDSFERIQKKGTVVHKRGTVATLRHTLNNQASFHGQRCKPSTMWNA